MADDRHGDFEQRVANAADANAAAALWRAQYGDRVPEWNLTAPVGWFQATVLVNKLYALASGADFVLGGRGTGDRAAAWHKVQAVREAMRTHEHCTHFQWVDSDAHLYMNGCLVAGTCAEETLTDVYSIASISDSTYESAVLEGKRLRHKLPRMWQRDVFLALNGMDTTHYMETEWSGGWKPFMGPAGDYICSGLFAVARTPRGEQFLDEWWSGPADEAVRNTSGFVEHLTAFPWEQHSLNHIMVPAFFTDIVVFPYSVMGSPLSPFARHVWTDYRGKGHFTEFVVEYLKKVLKTIPN
jgi:hypothetical protein